MPSFWTSAWFTPCNVIVRVGTSLTAFGISFVAVGRIPLRLFTTFTHLFFSMIVSVSPFFSVVSNQTTSLFFTLWVTFIIFTSPTGSQRSTSALTYPMPYGTNLFMNVFSKISSYKWGNGATSLLKRFIFSSIVDSCLITRNWLHAVPCSGDWNYCSSRICNPFIAVVASVILSNRKMALGPPLHGTSPKPLLWNL